MLAAASWVTVKKVRCCQPAISIVSFGAVNERRVLPMTGCRCLRRLTRQTIPPTLTVAGSPISGWSTTRTRTSLRHACASKFRSVCFPIFITLRATNLDVGVWLASPKLPSANGGLLSRPPGPRGSVGEKGKSARTDEHNLAQRRVFKIRSGVWPSRVVVSGNRSNGSG